MMADSIRFRTRQGKQIRNPVAPANILRLPAAGSKECNDTYFIGHAATLRARQGAQWALAAILTPAISSDSCGTLRSDG